MITKNQLCLSFFFFLLIWLAIEDSMTMDNNTVLLTSTILNIQLKFKWVIPDKKQTGEVEDMEFPEVLKK